MREAILWRYGLPLDAGVVLRHQQVNQRQGLVVRLTRDGQIGEGEIAPLPGFSRETLDEAADAALNFLTRWVAGDPAAMLGDDRLGYESRHAMRPEFRVESTWPTLPPSVAFGLSCALAELDGLLPDQGCYASVPLSSGDEDHLLVRLAAMGGQKIAKMKVGLSEAALDSQRVNTLLAAMPDLHLRLDANRSWCMNSAGRFAELLDPLLSGRIDFIEEPCASRAESLAFASATGLPIAWDESSREADFRPSPEPGVVAIIVKPSLVGSLARCRALIDQARQAGLVAVISSSIESSLALTQLARLALWLTPGVPPGLDTLSLMGAQLFRRWPDCRLPLQPPESLQLVARIT
jgi:O-succinylbenzoate synthase